MSKKVVEYKDLVAFHPGQYVEDLIEDYNVTQKEFAERLGHRATWRYAIIIVLRIVEFF